MVVGGTFVIAFLADWECLEDVHMSSIPHGNVCHTIYHTNSKYILANKIFFKLGVITLSADA